MAGPLSEIATKGNRPFLWLVDFERTQRETVHAFLGYPKTLVAKGNQTRLLFWGIGGIPCAMVGTPLKHGW